MGMRVGADPCIAGSDPTLILPIPCLPITRRINAERLVLLGWTRAILLQIAHPLVAAGVGGHSSFRHSSLSPLLRLRHTVGAMLAITFGDAEAHRRAIAAIDKIHHRVHGELSEAVGPFPCGTRYSARDPALLLWVHATLLESLVLVYERMVGPLTGAEKDACCIEAAASAIELGADASSVPRTWAALESYMSAEYESGRITVGREARALATSILSPKIGWALWPAVGINRTITAGLLPARLREAYGLPWGASGPKRFDRTISRLAWVRRRLPRGLALWRVART